MPSQRPTLPPLTTPPWPLSSLSGTVIGTLLNDPAALAALGDAVHVAPYKAPPRAPVLYVKPRNTLTGLARLPWSMDGLEVGASLGIVIGQPMRRVSAAHALDHVAGWTMVVDLFAPHADVYRPNVRMRALDGSCLVGPRLVPRDAIADPDHYAFTVEAGDTPRCTVSTAGLLRPVATLLQDVSEFMTLHPGDILMLGARHAMPQVQAGRHWRVDAPGIGVLEGRVDHEERRATPRNGKAAVQAEVRNEAPR